MPRPRALAAVMGHDAFHHWAHSGSGARLLACLDPLEGKSKRELAEAVGLHPTTVKRRMDRLVEDSLAELTDNLYYPGTSPATPAWRWIRRSCCG
ncbi:winged helix-turn-helix domain-containing protein [Streptomyces klenkii]|uniref:winged helix-turn-helix domain-containing protein n=1 Tax=Streptomyces klenkii TaxID=1420899 RepID=UPI0034189F43